MAKVLVCGVINWDITLFVQSLPKPGEEVKVIRSSFYPGGKGGNTAVAAAKIFNKIDGKIPGSHPAYVGVIGMLGNDDVAEKQIRILQREGVDTSCIAKQEGAGSGTAYVIVDSKGEGMILTDMAANQTMTEEFISHPPVSLSIDNANTLVVIDPPLDVASALLTRAKKHNAKTITTTIWSPALLTRHGLAMLQACMKDNVDYLILNEHEASYLASVEWNADAVAACRNLAKNLPRCKVVVTLGPKGCIFCHHGEEEAAGEKELELTLVTVPTMDLASYGLNIVSTVGAGDTFVGTFAALKTKGLDDLEALFTANIAAALKTTKEETRGGPTFDEVSYYRNTRYLRSLFSSIREKQIR